VVGHGNHLGAAWRLVSARFRLLRVLNPVLRLLSLRTNETCPEGYVFSGRRVRGNEREPRRQNGGLG
jgi:hypothetical protein